MPTATTARLPVILTSHALQSLRDSGYTLAAALGEVIDNSLEAEANDIRLRFDEERDRSGKKHIHRILISDDGAGMDEVILHHYLQLGYSTRYMSTKTIGKYGVGAKLAALNFGKKIDVWSRVGAAAPWLHVGFDLEDSLRREERGEEVGIEAPTPDPVPDDYADLLPAGSGTLVVWSKVDRLEEGRWAQDANALRVEVEKELSRMFRYFLNGGITLSVNGTVLLPHDPLMLMEGTWADKVLSELHAGEQPEAESRGRSARGPAMRHFGARVLARNEPIKIRGSEAILTVTLYPKEIVRQRGKGGDPLAKKLRVPENEGSISFVRLNREINYTNVPRIFPRGVEDPDRFIGIEIAFSPELDEYFGVRNVKRGVEPHDELRARIRELLSKYIPQAREMLDEMWGEVAREQNTHVGEHTAILTAAGEANRTLPKARAKGPENSNERDRILNDLARDAGKTDEKDRAEYLDRISGLPFVVESVDFPGANFLDIQHLDGQVIIRVNTRHRFYREMWEPIRSMASRNAGSVSGDEAVRTARRTMEALTLMVIAYGKAESMHEKPHDQYVDLRMYWGQFLNSLMGKVKDVF
ncbi:MAG TPA: ATP-binding protein [Longimicrobiaceae bacterium]|jgi:hypothetical protein|nr:ATP-binding protein [Longimicrobiaceae bacterium]